MNFNFCPTCGNKLVLNNAGDDGLIPYCKRCNQYFFDLFPVCVIAMVVNEFEEVVLLKQLYLSDKYLTFPAGYMTSGETPDIAILREIREETGLSIRELQYVTACWFNAKNILMLGFVAKCSKAKFTLSSEVDEAIWVSLADVPKFLFPEHSDNIAYKIYDYYVKNNIKPVNFY